MVDLQFEAHPSCSLEKDGRQNGEVWDSREVIVFF